MNCYVVTIVNYHCPLRVVATDFPSAYSKALQVISCWEGSEKYEITNISLIGPVIC